MLKSLSVALVCLAFPLAAQSTLTLSPCQDGETGAPHSHEDMGLFLQDSWRMSANGTGFTLGTNIMAVNLRWDAPSQTLRLEGGGEPSITLVPVQAMADEDSAAPFDMSTEALTPTGLSPAEVEVLTACRTPARYFWQFGSGSRKSWGGLMFLGKSLAVGFMANSAGGTRQVVMTR